MDQCVACLINSRDILPTLRYFAMAIGELHDTTLDYPTGEEIYCEMMQHPKIFRLSAYSACMLNIFHFVVNKHSSNGRQKGGRETNIKRSETQFEFHFQSRAQALHIEKKTF